jgi:hypothetical protein
MGSPTPLPGQLAELLEAVRAARRALDEVESSPHASGSKRVERSTLRGRLDEAERAFRDTSSLYSSGEHTDAVREARYEVRVLCYGQAVVDHVDALEAKRNVFEAELEALDATELLARLPALVRSLTGTEAAANEARIRADAAVADDDFLKLDGRADELQDERDVLLPVLWVMESRVQELRAAARGDTEESFELELARTSWDPDEVDGEIDVRPGLVAALASIYSDVDRDDEWVSQTLRRLVHLGTPQRFAVELSFDEGVRLKRMLESLGVTATLEATDPK